MLDERRTVIDGQGRCALCSCLLPEGVVFFTCFLCDYHQCNTCTQRLLFAMEKHPSTRKMLPGDLWNLLDKD